VTPSIRVNENWLTLKSGLRLRPVFHWRPWWIQAHVTVTVLALLLERVIESLCCALGLSSHASLCLAPLKLLCSSSKPITLPGPSFIRTTSFIRLLAIVGPQGTTALTKLDQS
jgi:hypothetical protein